MATRQKKTAGDDATRAFTVVLEDLRGQFRVFGERLDLLVAHMDERFARLDERVARLDEDLGLVKIAVLDIRRDLKNKVDRQATG